jgi:hypothetical protein
MALLETDLTEFDKQTDDAEKIGTLGKGVPCRICEKVFGRLRVTWRYCAQCRHAFCEGEHGTFAGVNRGRCIQCGPTV